LEEPGNPICYENISSEILTSIYKNYTVSHPRRVWSQDLFVNLKSSNYQNCMGQLQ